MKRLLFALIAPIVFNIPIEGKPVPQISDFKINLELPIRLNIFCPKISVNNENKNIKKDQDNCWIELNEEYINVMNLQKIPKKNILKYWMTHINYDYETCEYHFIYKTSENEIRELHITSNVKKISDEQRKKFITRGKSYIATNAAGKFVVSYPKFFHKSVNRWLVTTND